MDERVKKFGLKPESASGHYARKLDNLLGLAELKDSLYHLPVTGIRKFDTTRSSYDMPILPIHELLDREFEEDDSMLFKLQEARDEGSLPPSFETHPVVEKHNGRCIPISLYFDGVAYSNNDTVLGMWFQNMLTHKKSLFCVFRKRLTCRCGCRWWCSYWPVLNFIRWSLTCLSNGFYPSARHDDTPFVFSDSYRASLQGKPLKYPAACVLLKGDWAEFTERFGFPTWGSSTHPCFLCSTTADSMYLCSGLSILSLPWKTHSDADFVQSWLHCEKFVTLTSAAQHRRLLDLLHYDSRPTGSLGRSLLQDFDELNLKVGDRLEPCNLLVDVGEQFNSLTEFPRTVLFWRPSEQTLCLHHCPLFDPLLGLSPTRSIALDTLHTLNLGVMNSLCKEVVWFFLAVCCLGVAATYRGREAYWCFIGFEG